MDKVKVKVIGGVVDGQPVGTSFEINEDSAKYLESIGYVKIIEKITAKPKVKKGETSATKKSEGKATKRFSKDK